MKTNAPDLPIWETDQHPSLYRQTWKPHEEQIKIPASKIYEELQEQELEPWAETKKNMQDEQQGPDLLDLESGEEIAFVPNTNVVYFRCGCEEFIDTKLPHSLFRLCTAHRNKLLEMLEIDVIYGRY